MKIGLRVGTFCLVLRRDQGPLFLGGGTVGKTHFRGVREPLRKVVAGNGILIFPLDNSGHFFPGWLGSVGRFRAWTDPCEIGPATHHLHGVAEMHLEDGPVRAVVLEAWDVGRELFEAGGSNSGQRRRSSRGRHWSGFG